MLSILALSLAAAALPGLPAAADLASVEITDRGEPRPITDRPDLCQECAQADDRGNALDSVCVLKNSDDFESSETFSGIECWYSPAKAQAATSGECPVGLVQCKAFLEKLERQENKEEAAVLSADNKNHAQRAAEHTTTLVRLDGNIEQQEAADMKRMQSEQMLETGGLDAAPRTITDRPDLCQECAQTDDTGHALDSVCATQAGQDFESSETFAGIDCYYSAQKRLTATARRCPQGIVKCTAFIKMEQAGHIAGSAHLEKQETRDAVPDAPSGSLAARAHSLAARAGHHINSALLLARQGAQTKLAAHSTGSVFGAVVVALLLACVVGARKMCTCEHVQRKKAQAWSEGDARDDIELAGLANSHGDGDNDDEHDGATSPKRLRKRSTTDLGRDDEDD